jgi:hypothetical protein
MVKVSDYTCTKNKCSAEVKAVVSKMNGGTPLRTCSRHIVWAIEFISVPDQEVKVKRLSEPWKE